MSRPPHATQTISMALYLEDLEKLDSALEQHNADGQEIGGLRSFDIASMGIDFVPEHRELLRRNLPVPRSEQR